MDEELNPNEPKIVETDVGAKDGQTKCPKCGSENMTKISRMNGYLGYSRIKGRTRYNESKMAEIADRVSM